MCEKMVDNPTMETCVKTRIYYTELCKQISCYEQGLSWGLNSNFCKLNVRFFSPGIGTNALNMTINKAVGWSLSKPS